MKQARGRPGGWFDRWRGRMGEARARVGGGPARRKRGRKRPLARGPKKLAEVSERYGMRFKGRTGRTPKRSQARGSMSGRLRRK